VTWRRTATLTNYVIGASLALAAFLLVCPVAHGAQQECSLGQLQGHYIFAGQGSNLHFGVFEFDGAGKFSGKQTSLRQTTAHQHENLSGTYTLDADCTGTMTIEGQLGGATHWDFFLTADGRKGHMVRTDKLEMGVRDFER
jgi:hypothetical protein